MLSLSRSPKLPPVCLPVVSKASTSLHENHSNSQQLSDDNMLYIASPWLLGMGPEHSTESDIYLCLEFAVSFRKDLMLALTPGIQLTLAVGVSNFIEPSTSRTFSSALVLLMECVASVLRTLIYVD